jgi:hypothetical protein
MTTGHLQAYDRFLKASKAPSRSSGNATEKVDPAPAFRAGHGSRIFGSLFFLELADLL